ncbi:MAG: NAD(+) diphosphatase, partial [Kangiellaceae bacterium]|nr:NAD(+) diphosphatase [Kangiellaceae bacterium]
LIADEEELGLLFHSQGLFNWHRNHKYCAACGCKTEIGNAGHSRKCQNEECNKDHFPRIDPAVIFTISDNSQNKDRLLLARQAAWDEGRYSVIAGFVEPGESLENAVIRETYEEVGLKLKSASYVASQPWPFPSSMMVGFEAVTDTNEITLIDNELEHAMWISADEMIEEIESGKLKLPFSVSISWHLIDRWFHQQTGRSLATVTPKDEI